MSTTPSDAAVTSSIAELAKGLTAQLLQGRRIWLRHRAPKSKYVHQLRRDLAGEKRKSFEILLEISFADVDDGLAPAIATQAYVSAIALIQERAEQRAVSRGGPAIDPDAITLVERESEAQAQKDSAERAFIAEPASPATLKRLIDADASYAAANDRLVSAVRSRLARATLTGRVLQVG